jgi:hypothetical protein
MLNKLDKRISKGTTLNFQKGPEGMERGQYPLDPKEHIANIEQIVYIGAIAIRQGRGQTRSVVGLPNPRHKEHDR